MPTDHGPFDAEDYRTSPLLTGSPHRFVIRFLDPSGSLHMMAVSSTWHPGNEDDEPLPRIWANVLRGIEQAGCRVLEVARLSETTIEM